MNRRHQQQDWCLEQRHRCRIRLKKVRPLFKSHLALILVALTVIQSASCYEEQQPQQQQQQTSATQTSDTTNATNSEQNDNHNTTTNQEEIVFVVGKQQQQQTSEDSMKFPLYMRILATLACLVIFTIGVCGNLLVPLVVIKTKYLRNSTNLFLINLSIADLLVLTVCMPTVLIELHSRPETWLLGEPMCKLSNYVEMLAANGSIFTILAISFERYYAICKPLKAGYKCTRLRATIIICAIWLLSSILTSPILIMAKSSETIYIDGSLVYNCILETDTYWHKMYVFVSMFAFFCLPLLVLMLVYWLIGRRLTRENIAMSTTASLATSDSTETTQASSVMSIRKRFGLRKAASVKSLSTFLSAFNHHNYHHFNLNQSDGNQIKQERVDGVVAMTTPNQKRRKLAASKALSLDQHLMAKSDSNEPNSAHNNINGVITNPKDSQVKKDEPPPPMKMSLANQFAYHLFHLKSSNSNNYSKGNQTSTSLTPNANALAQFRSQPPGRATTTQARANGFMMHSISELHASSCLTTGSEPSNDDQMASQVPFLSFKDHNGRDLCKKRITANKKRGFIKRGSISSSSASTQTNCTTLPSDSSVGSTAQPRPIIHYNNSNSNSDSSKRHQADRKKFAHFNVNAMDTPTPIRASCSSVSESSSLVYLSKSSSPDSIDEQKSQHITSDHLELDKALSAKHAHVEDGIEADADSESRRKLTVSITNDCDNEVNIDNHTSEATNTVKSIVIDNNSENSKSELPREKRKSSACKANETNHTHHHTFHFNLRRDSKRNGSQPVVCSHYQSGTHLSELLVVQDLSKKQQMDSRRQVVVMLAFVVTCFFLLFFPYRVFTIWLILSTEDQVQSLGMETYYNLTYFSRILIYLHSAINPIAYNLISTKFRRAFMSILLCRGSSTRRHFTTEHRIIKNRVTNSEQRESLRQSSGQLTR